MLNHLNFSRIILPMKRAPSLPAPAIERPPGRILSKLRDVTLHGAPPFAQAGKNADKRPVVKA
jgi:hypothetical protein